MSVETLSRENLEELIVLYERAHSMSAWSDYPFERETFRRNIESAIDNPACFNCLYRKDGVLVGCFLATLGSPIFSSALLGMENGVYVDPEHRGGRIAFAMKSAFDEWCALHNAEPFVEIYFGNDEENEKTYNFFSKTGMIECGKIFRSKRNGML